MRKKPKSHSIKYMALLLVSAIVLPFAITLAWFTSTDSATGNLNFGESINVQILDEGQNEITDNLFSSSGKLLPNSRVTVKTININVAPSTTPLVMRAKVSVSATGGNESYDFNEMFSSLINVSAGWHLHTDGYYYYIGGSNNGVYVMTATEESTSGSGSFLPGKTAGAKYTAQTTNRTSVNSTTVLSSVYAQTTAKTISFSTGGQMRIPENVMAEDVAGAVINATLKVEAIQDFMVIDNVNVLPNLEHSKFLLDEEFLVTYSGYWSDEGNYSSLTGQGTQSQPWLISTPEQFAALTQVWTPQNPGASEDAYIELQSDINLEGKYWTPIESTSLAFGAVIHLKGNGHKISNVYIKNNTGSTGIFSNINQNGGKFSNLTIENYTVEITGAPAVGIGVLFGSHSNIDGRDRWFSNGKVENVNVINPNVLIVDSGLIKMSDDSIIGNIMVNVFYSETFLNPTSGVLLAKEAGLGWPAPSNMGKESTKIRMINNSGMNIQIIGANPGTIGYHANHNLNLTNNGNGSITYHTIMPFLIFNMLYGKAFQGNFDQLYYYYGLGMFINEDTTYEELVQSLTSSYTAFTNSPSLLQIINDFDVQINSDYSDEQDATKKLMLGQMFAKKFYNLDIEPSDVEDPAFLSSIADKPFAILIYDDSEIVTEGTGILINKNVPDSEFTNAELISIIADFTNAIYGN